MTPKQWISGIVQNLYTVLEGIFAKKSDVHTVTSGEFIGSMDRTDVTSSGNVSVRNTSGTFPTVPAGTYMVKTYMLSSTSSYTLTVTFGGQTYELTTSTGEFSDTRELTFESSATWSAQITTVASRTRLKVQVYSTGQVVSVVGPAAVSNDYNDLDNIPTNVSEFTNDSGYLTAHQDITGKQDVLVSGTNIKTINSTSLLGSGNLDLLPKSGGWIDGAGSLLLGDINGDNVVSIESQHIRVENDDDSWYVEIDASEPGLLVCALGSGGSVTSYRNGTIRRDNNVLALPSSSGTLALTSQIPATLSDLSDDMVSGYYLPLTGGTTTGPIVVGEMNGQLISTAQTTIDNEYVRIDNGLFGSNLRKAELNSDKIKYTVSSDTYDLAFPAASGTIALTSDITAALGDIETLLAAI